MFTSSVCSYPDRGPYGKSSYRGNCTGYIIKDFINTYLSRKDGLVADPSIGGGTSVDVAKELGIRFKGTDLHQGFNLLRDDFRDFLQEDANLIWWHPPYANMIEYSGNQWGEADKWDMSRMSIPEFAEALELAVMNIHDACERGGHYGILMGNLRRQGQYFNLSSLVERIAPGQLVDEIIKIQHNCVSDSRQYRGRLVRINHEKLLVFRRHGANGSIHFLTVAHRRAENLVRTTWRAVVRKILQGKTMDLSSIYQAVEPIAQQRGNQHWQAKVRQVLQDARYFHRVETGIYCLAS
ncbi:DNA adenine modification methylase [Alcaligenes faecalis]|uniref:DNA adenine modification methylase n=1 Tax=Alcaligenes faecalis TaxID=511 RepID=A0A1Z3MKT8_ALCFA|nr:DNA adenine modification methylase [Alcaligenes faecalis]ASD48419.1 DNA adenine modification methylase [Alcaligenes faecalis]OSZ33052.1 DNA adenine modification methylase [Alcaligenes faecalis]OSZ36364.1 DNA adenine modification methylase [Alcaligenes faecalis]WHQ45870.1 site-specific DNA-methyltransferase [Alcaligenes faecalis]